MARNRCKDHLLETAATLFSRNGYHATGIDSIIAEADVSRMSLYNNFESKEGLIESVLARQRECIEGGFAEIITGRGTAEERFERIFDHLGAFWNSDDYHGCPFVNAVAEYSEFSHPVHKAVLAHKVGITTLLTGLMKELNVREPHEVAIQVLIIIDGGAVRAQIFADKAAHEHARIAAKAVVKMSQLT